MVMLLSWLPFQNLISLRNGMEPTTFDIIRVSLICKCYSKGIVCNGYWRLVFIGYTNHFEQRLPLMIVIPNNDPITIFSSKLYP